MPWPGWLGPLDRMLVRDLWRMKGQALAIAFVIAGGVAVHLLAAGMLSSLQATRDAYYERNRFADVWAPVVRAPEHLLPGSRPQRCGSASRRCSSRPEPWPRRRARFCRSRTRERRA